MQMTSGLRKVALTAHIVASVGWLGSVAGFFALAIVGLASRDVQTVRGAYVAMELSTWYVIVPFAFASLLTGVVSSLGTAWGLLRYYWVLVKLLLTVLATAVLLMHLQPIEVLAASARADVPAYLQEAQKLMVVASGAALVAFIVLTTLSLYKPRGLTSYGWRKQREERSVLASADAPARNF